MTERVTEVVVAALREAEAATAPCSRCDGKGYHHGFGEDGQDPDWCGECGGGGCVPRDPTPEDVARSVVKALGKDPPLWLLQLAFTVINVIGIWRWWG